LLVVGVGNIGSEMAKIAQALGMEVRGVDIDQKNPAVSYVSIDKGMAWADIIVCAMSLTKDNAGYFDYERFQRARRGVVFVNVARGELSPTNDLVKLLDEGYVGALALDAYENESKLAVALRSGRAGWPSPPSGRVTSGALGERALPTRPCGSRLAATKVP
jgi:D-lactate dehydrogenase